MDRPLLLALSQMIKQNKELIMHAIKFAVYHFANGDVEQYNETIDIDNPESIKVLKGLHKRNNTLIVPLTDEGQIDLNGVEAVIKPGRRTSADWSAEMVEYAHTLRADKGATDNLISLELYAKFGVMISKEAVAKTLRQEINTGAELPDDLRQRAVAKTPQKGKGRNKYSDETKEAIIAYMEAGHSGVEAEKKFGMSNSQCNTLFRRKHGRRRP